MFVDRIFFYLLHTRYGSDKKNDTEKNCCKKQQQN